MYRALNAFKDGLTLSAIFPNVGASLHTTACCKTATLLRGPVPFDYFEKGKARLKILEKKVAAYREHNKLCQSVRKGDPYYGYVLHATGCPDETSKIRRQQQYTTGEIPECLSLTFLANEEKWRLLTGRQLWGQFNRIAWSLHSEVSRLAYERQLGTKKDLSYVLISGAHLARLAGGAMPLARFDSDVVIDEASDLTAGAAIFVARELHTDYQNLKENLLHEMAHWAAFRFDSPACDEHLSEVVSEGHGDIWWSHVQRIQGVFSDFVGYRAGECDTAVAVERTHRNRRFVRVETDVYLHAFECPMCALRVRYASKGSAERRVCGQCGHRGLLYIGEYDMDGRVVERRRADHSWRAFVRANWHTVQDEIRRGTTSGALRQVGFAEAMKRLGEMYRAGGTRRMRINPARQHTVHEGATRLKKSTEMIKWMTFLKKALPRVQRKIVAEARKRGDLLPQRGALWQESVRRIGEEWRSQKVTKAVRQRLEGSRQNLRQDAWITFLNSRLPAVQRAVLEEQQQQGQDCNKLAALREGVRRIAKQWRAQHGKVSDSDSSALTLQSTKSAMEQWRLFLAKQFPHTRAEVQAEQQLRGQPFDGRRVRSECMRRIGQRWREQRSGSVAPASKQPAGADFISTESVMPDAQADNRSEYIIMSDAADGAESSNSSTLLEDGTMPVFQDARPLWMHADPRLGLIRGSLKAKVRPRSPQQRTQVRP